MIHILICNKPSTRFPGKNELLFDYTYLWLLREARELNEEFCVYTVGKRLNVTVPRGWRHIDTPCNNHHEDIKLAMEAIEADAFDAYALPQLTQPLRRRGLLIEAVDLMREYGLPVISASRETVKDWRKIDVMGKWGERGNDAIRLMYDGALYVWSNDTFGSVFDNTAPHSVIANADAVVDIDYEDDMPPNLNRMWADLMIRK